MSSLLLFLSVSEGETDSEAISGVQFVSLSVDNSAGVNHLRLTVKAKKAGNFEGVVDIKKATQKSLEHFFIGLTLHDDDFWVNLNPDEPSRIINPALANTDLGRIMLNADYRLKEDVSNIINPQASKIGKEFWKRLYEKAEELGAVDKIPVITRLWIVPKSTEVYEKENQLYIVKSRLKVQLEPAYLSQSAKLKNKRGKELQDFAAELLEELVLPQLNKRVNESYAYADLRDIYNALILAHWYKEGFGSGYNSLQQIVNYQVLNDVETDYASTPDEIYQSYVKSIKESQYSFTETETLSSSFYTNITTRHYLSGGVDFRDIKMTQASSTVGEKDDNNSIFFTCELFIPQGIQRPLQYAKSNLELTAGTTLPYANTPVALVKTLPVIAPIRFAEQRIQNLDSVNRMDRLVLSKL